jgi:hypothetical protein
MAREDTSGARRPINASIVVDDAVSPDACRGGTTGSAADAAAAA